MERGLAVILIYNIMHFEIIRYDALKKRINHFDKNKNTS